MNAQNSDAHLAEFADRVGRAARPGEAWPALHALFDVAVGAKLFTVTTVDLARAEARRLYSSDAENYPVSGAKPILVDPWYEQVVVRHETFVQNTLADIAQHFPDHALIGQLGCGSVINLPVLSGGAVVATINCLDVEHRYTPTRVAAAEALRVQALAAWLVEERAG